MKRFSCATTIRLPVAVLAFCSVAILAAPLRAQDAATSQTTLPPRIAVTDDASYAQYYARYTELQKADPKLALQWLETLLKEQPQIPAVFHHMVVRDQGEAIYKVTGDLDRALAVYDREIATFSPDDPDSARWTGVHMMLSRVQILMGVGKTDEAAKFLDKQWPSLIKGAATGSAQDEDAVGWAARIYATALSGTKRDADNAAMLSKVLRSMPVLLVDAPGGGEPLVAQLASSLSKSGKNDEALGWAKLRYMTCDFTPEDLVSATRLLSQVWAGRDDFGAIGAFTRAQRDEETPAAEKPAAADNKTADAKEAPSANPLLKVELPTSSGAWQKALSKDINAVDQSVDKTLPKKRHQILGLLIARGGKGDLGRAMTLAKSLLREDPTSAEGAREVCRVFKAADLNTVRANQFIDYLNGKAKSPFSSFDKEYPAAAATEEKK